MAAIHPERDVPLGVPVPQAADLEDRLRVRRQQVVRLRRELLLIDLLATLALAAVQQSAGRGTSALTALAVFVVVGLGIGAADSPRAMIARRRVLRAALLLAGAGCALTALLGSVDHGREVVLGAGAACVVLVLVRLLVRLPGSAARYGLGRRRRLLVGDPRALESRAPRRTQALAGPEEIVVITRAERRRADPGTSGQVLRADSAGEDQRQERDETGGPAGVVGRVVRTALDTGAERVTVIPGTSWGQRQLRELSWSLEGTGIDMVIATTLDGIAPHRVAVTEQDGRLMINVGSASPRGSRALVKTAVDWCGALVLLVVLFPVLLAIGIAVRLGSDGPAIFRQTRVREGGGTFTMYKFRTMRVGAEKQLDALRAMSMHVEDGPLFKMENDPRVTRVGQLLRRTSLDELPQLVNVVRGQMSLIGPRPALPTEVAAYDFAARRRLAVKPGMTGLWQVSGRSRLTWDESIGFDLDYVDNWSVFTDASIAVRTLRAVVRKDGAF
jgi:exopolysaccharide biosynthesis polyprenyl glycosylphosphotransferase